VPGRVGIRDINSRLKFGQADRRKRPRCLRCIQNLLSGRRDEDASVCCDRRIGRRDGDIGEPGSDHRDVCRPDGRGVVGGRPRSGDGCTEDVIYEAVDLRVLEVTYRVSAKGRITIVGPA